MTTLGDTARLIRSKNAGPFYVTFDVMFDSRENYERACRSKALSVEAISRMYDVPSQLVELYHYEPAWSIKFTLPRRIPSCDLGDTDTHACQQFAPLVDLPLD